MEKTSIAASLLIPASTSACTQADQQEVENSAIGSAHAATIAVPLYPPLDPNASDGHVHEYY